MRLNALTVSEIGNLKKRTAARSVWSAWSLSTLSSAATEERLPLSSAQLQTKAPASWTHSRRFARCGCGCVTSRTWGLGLRTSGGFSLLELLGVLAIAAIVTAISAPVVIRQRDRAAYT